MCERYYFFLLNFGNARWEAYNATAGVDAFCGGNGGSGWG